MNMSICQNKMMIRVRKKMIEWIRFAFAAIFIIAGLFFMIFAVFGVYRYKYVLNRMHSAAMGDTLGILFCLVGLMIITGFSFATLKLLLVIMCLWLASPVTSHIISRLEVTTNDEIEKNLKKKTID